MLGNIGSHSLPDLLGLWKLLVGPETAGLVEEADARRKGRSEILGFLQRIVIRSGVKRAIGLQRLGQTPAKHLREFFRHGLFWLGVAEFQS